MAQQLTQRLNKATVGEIFQYLKEAKTKKERIVILNQYKNNAGVKTLLRLQYDPKFKFALPEGVPPNLKENKTPAGLGEATILNSIKQFYLFLEGTAPKLKQLKRESLFLGFLESLDKIEAELMIQVKDKKVNVGLTRAIVDEVYPGLIPPQGPKNETGKKEVRNSEGV